MTKEDLDFLKDLQHELNTQTNDGNADPVYWGIMERKEVLQPDNNGDIVYFTDEYDDMTYTQEEFAEHITEVVEDYEDDVKERWAETDKSDYYEIRDMANDLDIDFTEKTYDIEDVLSLTTNCFLTKRAAQEYIDKFGYNHSEPRTYAMTAYRNFELEKFLKIFKEMDLSIFENNDLQKEGNKA